MTEDPDRSEDASLSGVVLGFVRRNFRALLVLLAVAVLVVLLADRDLQVGRRGRLVLVTGVLVSPYGYIVWTWAISKFWEPEWIWLVDVDCRDLADAAVFRFPYEDFLDLETVDGELADVGQRLYFGKQVDLDEMTVEGTWPGTLDDRELLVALQKVKECRDELEKDAKIGFVMQASAWVIIRRATINIVETVIETFKRGTLPDNGKGINEAVDDVIDEFELDQVIAEVSDDPTPEFEDLVGDPADHAATPEGRDVDLADVPDDEEAVGDD